MKNIFEMFRLERLKTPIIAAFSSILVLILLINEPGISSEQGSDLTLDFKFGAVGDWGCSPNTESVVKNIMDNDLELVIGLGDYSYESRADCFLRIVDPIDDKMKIAIGNHETESSTKLNQLSSHFNLTTQYYSFNYKGVHFTAIADELPYEIDSEQYDFVLSDLANAASDPSINWMVVYYHRPAYLSPSFLTPSPSKVTSASTIRDTYHVLFDKYGVDLVLQGHQHNYQRTYPLKYNASTSSNPIVTDYDLNHYNEPMGQIYATVGTGGFSIHDFLGKSPYMATQYLGYGFLNIVVKNNGSTLTATFFDNDGTIKDQFTITKQVQNSNNESKMENK